MIRDLRFLALVFFVAVILSGCETHPPPVDMKVLKANVETYLEGTELSPYIDDYSLTIKEFENSNSKDITIYASVNDEFVKLTDSDKFKIFNETGKHIDSVKDKDGKFCGKNVYCHFYEIKAINGENIYTGRWGFSDYVSDEMAINGRILTDFDFEERTEPIFTPSKTSSNKSSERAIYEFMKSAFDIETNYGEYYIPEVHDPLVGRMAAEKFGISPNEALDIYTKFEMQGY